MAGRFGGYTSTKLEGYSQQQQAQRDNTYGGFFRQGSAIRDAEKKGIYGRAVAQAQREKQEAIENYQSVGQQLERADAQQEGNVAIGRIGKNVPGDTRLAQTLAALGIDPDFMRAIVASAQLPPGANR